MDAAEHVPGDQHAVLAEMGLNHGSGTVRLAALPIFAATSGTDAAIDVARRGPVGQGPCLEAGPVRYQAKPDRRPPVVRRGHEFDRHLVRSTLPLRRMSLAHR